jgi:MSHA pilin protein MshA
MKAAINSAVSLTYGKSLVLGKEKEKEDSITINGSPVDVCYGYPCAKASKIQEVLDIGDFKDCTADDKDKGDWCYKERAADKSIDIYIANGYTANSQCFVTYTESSAAGSAPKVALSPNVNKC